MKIQLVVIFVFIALFASGHGQDQKKQIYCGRRLSQALAWLCENEFSSHLVKRSSYNSDFGYKPDFSWQWLAARSSGLTDSNRLTDSDQLDSRALSGPKGKRQIIEECCLQPCSIEVLLTYCDK